MTEKIASLGYISKEESIKSISLEHSNYLLNNNYDEYINFKLFSDDKIPNITKKISQQWYRDNSNKDIYRGQFSFGIAMENRIQYLIANSIKYYFALKDLSINYDSIYLPYNLPQLLLDICLEIDKKKFLKTDNNSNDCTDLESILNNLAAINYLHVSRLSIYMRIFEKILFLNKKNKIIIFPDWTYNHYLHDNYLYQNSKNIFNGFYFRDCKNIDDVKNDFPTKLKNIDISNLINELDIEDLDKHKIERIIQNQISKEYLKSIDSLCYSYIVFKELFENYKPKSILTPTFHHHWHVLIAQIARKKNIKSYVILDGYATFYDKFYYTKDRNGIDYLFDDYVFTGSLSKNLTDKYFNNITGSQVVFPSSTKNNIHKNNPVKKYTAIVLLPAPLYENPNALYDQRFKYIIEVLEVLISLEINNIAIKIKDSKNNAVDNDEIVLQKIINKLK